MKNLILISLVTLYSLLSYSQDIKVEKYCKKIQKTIDKFTGEIEFRTPILNQISFNKVINNSDTTIYMSVSAIGSTPPSGKGVILLLENGEKIEKNVKTDVRVNSNAQFEHSALFKLSEEEIEKLKIHSITDVRIYIFDAVISNPKQYQAFLVCLDQMK